VGADRGFTCEPKPRWSTQKDSTYSGTRAYHYCSFINHTDNLLDL
jgi:hypothetical protein